MIKLMIGALLMTTTALAQNPQSTKNTASRPKSTTEAATSYKSNRATQAAARSDKPIPKPSKSDNLESKDNAIPSYRQAKSGAGKHRADIRFKPRRNDAGERLDTMTKKQP
ncbi:hypothetical protein WBJ53_29430 [Spirosoma sp. SC4-14]|uniref:hypothetical protein n=1 Tax=Spirosoma sp. SC4-14 TaxID=3128900 RepID=UPI0030CCC4F2